MGLRAAAGGGGGPRDGDAAAGGARPATVGHPLLYRPVPCASWPADIDVMARQYRSRPICINFLTGLKFYGETPDQDAVFLIPASDDVAVALRAQRTLAVAARGRGRRLRPPLPPHGAPHRPRGALRRHSRRPGALFFSMAPLHLHA